MFNRGKDDAGDKKPAPKKDNKPAGEGGGLGARFSAITSQAKGLLNRGDKDAPKPGTSSSAPGRPGGPSSPSRPGGASPAADEGRFAAIKGRVTGLFNRGEKAAAPPSSTGSRPGSPSPSSSGGARSTGSNPVVSPSPRAQAAASGAASATRQATSRGAAVEAEPRGGIWEGLMGRLRGAPKAETQPQSRTKRESSTRVPELDTSGWSLDTKLDLVGIGLMLFSLIMLLTSASGDQGQMMGAVNRFVGQIFGWGAVAVPLVLGGVGVFLLVTRFGDEPPEIDVVRFAGAVSGYLALLTLFQFIVVLDPIFGSGDLGTLKLLVEGLTWEKGQGGGFIGGQLHLFLIENIGEIGGFVLLIGWLAVSAMLITRTTATQLVVIIVSLYRSFRVSTQHRQQRRAAERTLAAQAQAEQQARIAISRPAVPELKPGIAGALTAGDMRQQPLPINEEPIPIRLGGQLVSATVAPQAPSMSQPSRTGAIGGLLKRIPGRSSNGNGVQSDPATETAPTGGLRGFISRRSGTTANPTLPPAVQPAAAFAPPPAAAPQHVPAMAPPPSVAPPAQPAPAYTQPQTAPAPSPYAPPQQPAVQPAAQQPAAQPAPASPGTPAPLFNPGQAAAAEQPGVRQMHAHAPAVANNTVITPPKAPSIETVRSKREYIKPDYTQLLAPGAKGDYDRKALIERSRVIAETLESFGAPGKVVEINTGPVITQFGVEPGYVVQRDRQSRVKVSAIAQLDKDLQLALGARSIRIEAPVPGKGYVGIEVPNDTPMTVSLRDLIDSPRYKRIQSPLALAFGEAVDGTPVAADLTGMPHLLIAGTTGSGKSVMVNAIICALMLRNTPDDVRFIMVDPKRVELTGYNGIPHLVAPVVVDVERIIGVLKWVTREMDDRYKKFSVAGARNIEDYNRNRAPNTDKMPYIVVIIDELADLMMLAPEEAERYITRIAAMARATGIHLVIATQRPSADVVTGLIKANFPARIAFAVASNVDSRVILDQPGAEKLLGRGDMLYLSGDSPAPQRLQGVFVSDKEIQAIVAFWKQQGDNKPSAQLVTFAAVDREDEASSGSGRSSGPSSYGGGNTRGMATGEPVRQMRGMFDEEDEDDDADDASGEDMPDDELYNRAVELVRRQNGASVSLLQRKMRIGYARAARLIDAMEDRGVVGPSKEGSSKQRDVLPPSLSNNKSS
jgi:S-DNA-T family DNA segregation ATPase FtsK/SpoIIIE